MSYFAERYHLNKLPNQSLAVIQCGLQTCHPGHTGGWLLYDHYSATFVLDGKGIFTVNGRNYPVHAGQGFIITPGSTNVYVADQQEPWRYIYVIFMGADDDSLVHNAGLDEENVIFDFPLDESMLHDLYAMHRASKNNTALGYDVTGYFLLVMSRLIKANRGVRKIMLQPEHYVKKAILFIENHYPEGITVNDIARAVGIDRTYLYKLFKRFLKQSPTDWLTGYRLEKSVEMMEKTDVSMNEIALSTGFYDVSHFYKTFASKYGLPPKKYRDQIYGRKDD